ncbi:Heat stress transcription factor A-2 [Vitis vinifera]|uniref:Heat stress transcription factor A-2 n=1 Tax=Vitis vinifera TaxID=29760 RepID=A0A438J8V8_VITVI|nr:Heat stress transcription factor A-2 [Vitis vinifera]
MESVEVKEESMWVEVEDSGELWGSSVAAKEEKMLEADGGGESGWCCSSLAAAAEVAKPMEGLHEAGPPPFLKKTFEMVEDPETDSVVSWSVARNSFIVWDSHNFFPESSSQGFRKIDSDRWEFANEAFQGGKRHLLKNIKRRRHGCLQQQGSRSGAESVKLQLEAEVESLRKDQNILNVEILRMRQQQETSQNHLTAVEERIRGAECKQKQMFIFMAKAVKNPSFVQQLIQKRQKRELGDGEIGKKRRLASMLSVGSLLEAICSNQTVHYRNQNLVQEEPSLQSEIQSLFCSGIDDESGGSPPEDQEANVISGTGNPDLLSFNNGMLEKLMEEDPICQNEAEELLSGKPSILDFELEEWIEKPVDWSVYVKELMELQFGCV